MTDVLVLPYAERLLDCLCDALATSLGGPVCRCCLRPGGHLVPMDSCYCECAAAGESNGQASVQVTDVYATSKFPRKGIDVFNNACAVSWVAELTMTVYRCVHTVDEKGIPPTCPQLDSDARKIASDRFAMMQAFACCDWALEQSILPGSWSPVPPQGGCAGGFMTVLVDVGAFCCPPVNPE